MSDGKDLVGVELTFHKALPTKPYYKKRAESRRQPAPSAGEWSRQPAAATRPSTTTRTTPARRQPNMERGMPPPPTHSSRHYKTTHHTGSHTEDSNHPAIADHHQTATSNIYLSSQPAEEVKDAVSISASRQEKEPYPLRQLPTSHILYMRQDLQEVHNVRMMNSDTVIVKAQRLQRPDEAINIDLPAFFMYKLNASDKKWVMVKGPTSRLYVENIYEHIEKKLEKGTQQKNIISWYYLQQACEDPGGQI